MTSICKNDYYKTSPWLIRAATSISRASTKRYKLTKQEQTKGYYLFINQGQITLKVPFRALFDSNDKIKPIVSLSFCSAIDCPSDKRGFCQLSNSGQTCYAKQGQKQASGTFVNKGKFKGIPQINSLDHSILVMTCIESFKQDKELFNRFIDYVNNNIPVLRFNLKGDFKDNTDINWLINLVLRAKNTVFYGYTAREDLMVDYCNFNGAFECNLTNFYLNGSNEMYTNRFKATYDLREWLTSSKICLGGCNKCAKCYSLKNSVILCLVHGKNQDKDLNTWLNRQFITRLFNSLNSSDSPKLTDKDLTVKTGLLESLNHQLTNKLNIDLKFDNYWNLREWLQGLHYEIEPDQISDYEYLKSLGVA